MPSKFPRRRPWLAGAAVVLVLACLLPPAGTYARRYIFVESFQFALFAAALPPLLVLGAPWRALGASRLIRGPGRDAAGGSAFLRGAGALLAFMGAVIAWRLPVLVNALATQPGLAVVEMVTLTGAGTALWLQLVESPPLLPRLPRPLRAVFAALAMWTIWVLAYMLGFAQSAWFTAYSHPGLGTVADQEIATGIMWGVSAACFIPVVYVLAMTWLRDTEDPDEGLRAIVREHDQQSAPGRWPRPPRGWRSA